MIVVLVSGLAQFEELIAGRAAPVSQRVYYDLVVTRSPGGGYLSSGSEDLASLQEHTVVCATYRRPQFRFCGVGIVR